MLRFIIGLLVGTPLGFMLAALFRANDKED